MVMSKEEIVADYRQSKTKMKQIGILADLNVCKREEIIDILLEAGEELPKNYRKKRAAAPPAAPVRTCPADCKGAPSPNVQDFLSAEKLVRILTEGFDATRDVEVVADGARVRFVHLYGVYDVHTDKTEWCVNLIPEETEFGGAHEDDVQ